MNTLDLLSIIHKHEYVNVKTISKHRNRDYLIKDEIKFKDFGY